MNDERNVLIDTLWNVKGLSVNGCSRTTNGINRYTMECKDNSSVVLIAITFVLIDTLWNVKTEPLAVEGSTVTVLIDTLWNVKNDIPNTDHVIVFVLIDTLWNVKYYTSLFIKSILSY